jgi:hypothetical protein
MQVNKSRSIDIFFRTVRALGVLDGDAAEVRGADEGPAERELPGLPQGLELETNLGDLEGEISGRIGIGRWRGRGEGREEPGGRRRGRRR